MKLVTVTGVFASILFSVIRRYISIRDSVMAPSSKMRRTKHIPSPTFKSAGTHPLPPRGGTHVPESLFLPAGRLMNFVVPLRNNIYIHLVSAIGSPSSVVQTPFGYPRLLAGGRDS